MRLDSGILKTLRLENVAEPGMMPVWKEVLLERMCYGERTVGASRYYTAQQADIQVDMIVRVPRTYTARTGDRVRLKPYSHCAPDLPYIIVQVQQVDDEDTNLPATDYSIRVMTESEMEACEDDTE